MTIIHGDNKVEDVINNEDRMVLLNFWATWCGPCKMFHPQLVELDEKHSETVQVIKINIDEYPEVAEKYGVMSIPNSRIIKNKEISKPIVGFLPYDRLINEIEKLK